MIWFYLYTILTNFSSQLAYCLVSLTTWIWCGTSSSYPRFDPEAHEAIKHNAELGKQSWMGLVSIGLSLSWVWSNRIAWATRDGCKGWRNFYLSHFDHMTQNITELIITIVGVSQAIWNLSLVDISNPLLGDIQELCWQVEVGRWFVKCKLYFIVLFSKNVNWR